VIRGAACLELPGVSFYGGKRKMKIKHLIFATLGTLVMVYAGTWLLRKYIAPSVVKEVFVG
jgi:hypothetical protein